MAFAWPRPRHSDVAHEGKEDRNRARPDGIKPARLIRSTLVPDNYREAIDFQSQHTGCRLLSLHRGGARCHIGPHLRPTIDKISGEQPTQFLVDLSRLRIIDGSGVGAIVSLFKTVRSYDGKMAALGAKGQPLAVMRILHLDRVLMRRAAHLTTGTP